MSIIQDVDALLAAQEDELKSLREKRDELEAVEKEIADHEAQIAPLYAKREELQAQFSVKPSRARSNGRTGQPRRTSSEEVERRRRQIVKMATGSTITPKAVSQMFGMTQGATAQEMRKLVDGKLLKKVKQGEYTAA